MRVLTVRQPWAWAIVHGGKDVENRVRPLGPYRGLVAIHAAVRDAPNAPPTLEIAWQMWWGNEQNNGRDPGGQRGHVIGVIDLVGEHTEQDCAGYYGNDRCTPWAMAGHRHLELANPRPLAIPVPARGRLGLWRPDDALSAAIEQQLALVGTEPLAVAPPATSPDCQAEKCRACSGDAWDHERDVLVPCAHDCHGRAS
ncbi:hypothetical protein [Cellulomonas sp.]|uniref:hypothetical protein n=1 Tax=Cellulomonas sp. TaxID=40001 RepID=UPI001B0B954D|nr:hypothetical protein [Cellulomonas sp.]MBO9555576.1 hypothetical protein [Cellulomonas sp.]